MENEYVGMMKDTAITIKINDATYTFTATADAGATLTFQDDKFFITPGSNDGGLKINLTKDKATAFEGELNVTGGTITFDPAEQKFSFTKGTKIALTMLDGSQEIDFEITEKFGTCNKADRCYKKDKTEITNHFKVRLKFCGVCTKVSEHVGYEQDTCGAQLNTLNTDSAYEVADCCYRKDYEKCFYKIRKSKIFYNCRKCF